MIREAEAQGLEHLWLVGGGVLASSFLKQGLMTDISVTELPVDLDNGIPIFANHALAEIECHKREINQKTGFKQIVLEISG